MTGLRLALSWLTVIPVTGPTVVDRAAAGRAIALAPLIGVLLGGTAAGVGRLLTSIGTPPSVAGLLIVAVLALGTRGMHLDGLADTMDGLGSYAAPQRAREIMRSGGTGPFGAAALVLAIGLQAAGFAVLLEHDRWAALATAVAAGRVTVVLACRRGITAAEGSGFGALVADSQPLVIGSSWTLLLLLAAGIAVPSRPWQGPTATVVALIAALLLTRHAYRRFGGLSGDLLGAAIEITLTLSVVGLSMGTQ